MTDEYWPALFYKQYLTDLADQLDTYQMPEGTTGIITFGALTTNVLSIGGPDLFMIIYADGVPIFSTILNGVDISDSQTIELPLQGYVIPGGTLLTFKTMWEPDGDGSHYLGWYICGVVTARPPLLGITGSGPPP